MKQFFKILALAALALPFTGCDVEYDPIVVQPDVALEDSGMTTVPTVSIYQNDAYTVTLARTEGLSRAAEFDIVVDEALIDEYNELNGASLEPMPASGYTIGVTSVAFAEKAKTATFSIQFKPQAIVAAAGSPRRAENFVIPFAWCPPDNGQFGLAVPERPRAVLVQRAHRHGGCPGRPGGADIHFGRARAAQAGTFVPRQFHDASNLEAGLRRHAGDGRRL